MLDSKQIHINALARQLMLDLATQAREDHPSVGCLAGLDERARAAVVEEAVSITEKLAPSEEVLDAARRAVA